MRKEIILEISGSAKNEDRSCLFASGNRQINQAISMLGLKPQTAKVAVILFGSEEEVDHAEKRLGSLINGVRDDDVLEAKQEKTDGLMKAFGITKVELETLSGIGMRPEDVLTWLIVERGALLFIKR